MTPTEVMAFAKNKGARILDLRFMDFPGLWQPPQCSDWGAHGGAVHGWPWL